MTDSPDWRHGLDALLGGDAAAGISIVVRSDLGHINLRGNAGRKTFRDGVQKITGSELPLEPNTFSGGERRIYWLGPDEWLVLCDADEASELSTQLEKRLSKQHAAVNVLSGGQLAIGVSGDCVPELLSKACTLDLDPLIFEQGACAQSGLAKAAVLISRLGPQYDYEIIVRRSFSYYLLSWLRHAAREYGVQISATTRG